jgi:hypothetical protein
MRAAAVEADRPAVATLDPIFLDDIATRFLTTAARLRPPEARRGRAGKHAALRLTGVPATKDADGMTPVVRRRRLPLAALYGEWSA